VIPNLLDLLGGFSAGLAYAPALQVLTWLFLVITVLMPARAWRLAPSHGSWRGPAWKNRATYTLITSTALAATLWSLRFANVLGERPL